MDKHSIELLVQEYLEKYPNDMHAMKVMDLLANYDNFWQRENEHGHLTASAWVVDDAQSKVLLTHHKKLDIWLQLGGHIEEEDTDIYTACRRELIEESGLIDFELLSSAIFDIDVHSIPLSKKGIPAHFHYDIRLLFRGDSRQKPIFDIQESNQVDWIDLDQIANYSNEVSVIRMVKKSLINFFSI
jgi:8-oxo-dGTP pyrophosphatase MutT (NUDIX family)